MRVSGWLSVLSGGLLAAMAAPVVAHHSFAAEFDINRPIKLDGVATREMALHELREHIGIVPQDAVIFSSSAMDNIRYGRPGATDDEVMDAFQLCSRHDTGAYWPSANTMLKSCRSRSESVPPIVS